MKDHIERAMAFATLVDFPGELSPENIGLAVARKAIDALPAADVVEVRHGRWLEYDGADKGFHYCSECKRQAFNYKDGEVVAEVLSDWCPHCGTRMDKETDHEAGA